MASSRCNVRSWPWQLDLPPKSKTSMRTEYSAGRVRLRRDQAERCRCRRRSFRRPEAGMIEQVEELRTKVEVTLLGHFESLSDRSAEIEERRHLFAGDRRTAELARRCIAIGAIAIVDARRTERVPRPEPGTGL